MFRLKRGGGALNRKTTCLIFLLLGAFILPGYNKAYTSAGKHLHWASDPVVSINSSSYTSSFASVAGLSDISEEEWQKHIIGIGMQWGVYSGSSRNISWGQPTTAACTSNSDQTNVVGTYSANATNLGAINYRFIVSTGRLVEADICINDVQQNWALSDSLSAGQFDMRRTLMHEFGHFFGLEHSASSEPASVMAPVIGGMAYPSLTTEDQRYMRDIYGIRSRSATIRRYNPAGSNWLAAYSVKGARTNLPITATITDDNYVVAAVVNTDRKSVTFYSTQLPVNSSSSWLSKTYNYPTEFPVAISATVAGAVAFASIVRPSSSFSTCDSVQILVGNAHMNTVPLAYVDKGVCTKTGTALARDPSSNRMLLAYTASPFVSSPRVPGGIYIRPSALLFGFDSSKEVYTGLVSGYPPVLACDSLGGCVVSAIETAWHKKTPGFRRFSVDSSGDITMGSYSGWYNWVENSEQVGTVNVSGKRAYTALGIKDADSTRSYFYLHSAPSWLGPWSPWSYTGEYSDSGVPLVHRPEFNELHRIKLD